MFCRNCGKQVSASEEYCSECRNNLPRNMFSNPNNQFSTKPKKCCPQCGSRKLQVVTTNKFQSKFVAKGYGAGKGCCGYMLFGPIGLLCGACGTKAKNEVNVSSSNIWVCLDCGEKFRDIEDIDKDIKKYKSNRIVIPILVSIIPIWFGLPVLILSLYQMLFQDFNEGCPVFILSALFCLIFVIWAIWEYMSAKSKLDGCIKEKEYIENSFRFN